jgi:hypothetical protein
MLHSGSLNALVVTALFVLAARESKHIDGTVRSTMPAPV